MRFLHTADWQIGMKAAALGDAGARVREERLAAGRRVVEAAKSHSVDFVLVAPDRLCERPERSLTPTFGDHVVEIRSIEPEFKKLMEG